MVVYIVRMEDIAPKKTVSSLKSAIAKSSYAKWFDYNIEEPHEMDHSGRVEVFLDPESKMSFEGERTCSVTPFWEDMKGSRSEAIADAIDYIKNHLAPLEPWLAEEHGIKL